MNIDIKKLEQIYSVLQDDESRVLFNLRLNYAFNRKEPEFIKGIRELNKKWKIIPNDDFKWQYRDQKIIIFGAGEEGFLTEQILECEGYKVFAYCDNNPEKQGSMTPTGRKILAPFELPKIGDEYFVIVASKGHGHEMYRQILTGLIAPHQNVFMPHLGAMRANTGIQYFDLEAFGLDDNEIFVDMGMFDGNTSFYVAQNCKYKKIIGFEASRLTVDMCRKRMEDCENVEIYQYAAWDKKEVLNFDFNGGGSRVTDGGRESVTGESLDNVLRGEKVTFIKMDIEGAEEKALVGAKDTIAQYKPKLAISIYHKPSDIFVLPECILNIRDDYKFWLRHYSSCMEETVLYAI